MGATAGRRASLYQYGRPNEQVKGQAHIYPASTGFFYTKCAEVHDGSRVGNRVGKSIIKITKGLDVAT
jgi:hypothetical protein